LRIIPSDKSLGYDQKALRAKFCLLPEQLARGDAFIFKIVALQDPQTGPRRNLNRLVFTRRSWR